jgi:unsaturated chondroitin disaccharide hydrolase
MKPSLATPPLWQAALAFGVARVNENRSRLTSFPKVAHDGRWEYADDGGWVGGHWVGLLWLAYAHTHDDALCQAARAWAARLVPRQFDETTHDLGFLFELSHVLGARITGDAALKPPALNAARNLARRFNERGKFIQAWGALDAPPARRGCTIIDTLMNLNLLYWASAETGDPQSSSIATEHARTALARQVRPDGSTAHVADFDPDTGAFLKQDTHQGLSVTSCWSRGQAWAVYGFTNCYQKTRDADFLGAARGLADYALRRLPADRVPYWDYDSPLIPNDVRDSSAAAILASGLLRLAAVEPDAAMAERWRVEATRIVESLWQNYSSRGTKELGILLHGTRNKPRGFMDHGLIYGDYYFVEALMLLGEDSKCPIL